MFQKLPCQLVAIGLNTAVTGAITRLAALGHSSSIQKAAFLAHSAPPPDRPSPASRLDLENHEYRAQLTLLARGAASTIPLTLEIQKRAIIMELTMLRLSRQHAALIVINEELAAAEASAAHSGSPVEIDLPWRCELFRWARGLDSEDWPQV